MEAPLATDDAPATPPVQAAVVTPVGVGGVSVIQVVGSGAHGIVESCLRNLSNSSTPRLAADTPRLCRWLDGAEPVDEVIVSRSTTLAQRMTISCHGGIRVVERILACLQRAGVQIKKDLHPARLWDGLDGTAAALLEHLPRARTPHVAQWLAGQTVDLRYTVSAAIQCLQQDHVDQARVLLERLQDTYDIANRLLDGFQAVIVGPPNAGKSTLANRLFDVPWSVESEQEGTTRDWVHQSIAIDGIPFTLADTAGIRATMDELERAALRQSRALIRRADVQLVVLDASRRFDHGQLRLLVKTVQAHKCLLILNKSDLPSAFQTADLLDALHRAGLPAPCGDRGLNKPLHVSALYDRGLEEIKQSMRRTVGLQDGTLPSPVIWDAKQRQTLGDITGLLSRDPLRAAARLTSCFLTDSAGNDAVGSL